jgi:hypothetical protein
MPLEYFQNLRFRRSLGGAVDEDMGLSFNHAYTHALSVLIPAWNVLGVQLVEQRFPLDMVAQRNFSDVDGPP